MKKYLLGIGLFALCTYINGQNPYYPAINGANSYNMHDEQFYDPNKEWCYIPKTTTVIGIPFTPSPVQVTYDGAIYTNESEMFFFYGKNKTPLLATQKTFYQGWIPIVEYTWNDNGLNYSINMFGWSASEQHVDNSIQHIQVRISNPTQENKLASFGTGIRGTGKDHRFGKSLFQKGSTYSFEGNNFLRDGKIVYSFSGSPLLLANKENKYSTTFSDQNFPIEENTAIGLTCYEKELQPGESYTIEFKFPRRAISDKEFINLYKQLNYTEEKEKCINYWKQLIEGNGHFSIPEKRVNDSYKAALVHLCLATRTHENGIKRQGSGLPYDGLFFIDFIDMRLAYDVSGLSDFVEVNFDWLRNSINEEGLFVDSSVSHNREIMTSHGQALYSICNHFRYVDNKKLAKSMLNTVKKAVALIEHDHKTQPTGLVRPSLPFDAEMIQGHYTGQNLFCLLGLRSAISYAEYLGLKKEAKEWRDLEHSYRNSILLALEQSAQPDGYIPPGLYDYKYGEETGWPEYNSNQDWENPLLIYPSETLTPSDPKVLGTLKHIRKNKFREGIMTYRNGMHLHQYVTTNLTNQHIAINDQRTALYDLYHILLHNGSTHEGFENLINPWGDRDPIGCPPPHAWAAAKTAMLIRNCLIREYGGEAGMNMDERSLYLYSILSPNWVKEGKRIQIINACTEFGEINSDMNFTSNGAIININSKYRYKPKAIYIPIPYFKTLVSVKVDNNKSYKYENGYIICSPDVKKITINWKDKETDNELYTILKNYRKEPSFYWDLKNFELYTKGPNDIPRNSGKFIVIPGLESGFLSEQELSMPKEELSFELVKKAYQLEYNRRKMQYLQAGKSLIKVEAPNIE